MWHAYRDGAPIVVVTLHGPGSKSIPIPALVDSGADAALFHVQLAETVFGLRRSRAVRSSSDGIGPDPLPVWTWASASWHLEFGGHRFRISPEFADLTGPNLLGRWDFFAQFRVAFDEPGQRVHISRDHAQPWPPQE